MREWVLLGTSTTMFGLALAHVALSLKLTLIGFVANGDTVCGVFMALESWEFESPLWFARLGIYVTQTLIGDVFMIYRVFLVWNRSWKVIFLPTILCLVHGVCGYVTLGGLLRVYAAGFDLPANIFTLLAFFCLSFTSNVLCSVLIIWRVFRSADQYMPPSTRLKLFGMVVEAIVQSAAIYSMASISLIITNVESIDIGFEACLSIFPPLIGLVFSFIVLRMARSSAEDVARLTSHTWSSRSDKCRDVIPPTHPMNIQLPKPPIPPATFYPSTLDFPEDEQATASSNTSTKGAEPGELFPRNMSLHAEDRDLEGPPGEVDIAVLDIRASKASWNV
ncbi:hypothetical protein VTO73DRAFT_11944 [Trametes versicolor]